MFPLNVYNMFIIPLVLGENKCLKNHFTNLQFIKWMLFHSCFKLQVILHSTMVNLKVLHKRPCCFVSVNGVQPHTVYGINNRCSHLWIEITIQDYHNHFWFSTTYECVTNQIFFCFLIFWWKYFKWVRQTVMKKSDMGSTLAKKIIK